MRKILLIENLLIFMKSLYTPMTILTNTPHKRLCLFLLFLFSSITALLGCGGGTPVGQEETNFINSIPEQGIFVIGTGPYTSQLTETNELVPSETLLRLSGGNAGTFEGEAFSDTADGETAVSGTYQYEANSPFSNGVLTLTYDDFITFDSTSQAQFEKTNVVMIINLEIRDVEGFSGDYSGAYNETSSRVGSDGSVTLTAQEASGTFVGR